MADRIDHVAEALSLLATPAALAESIRGREVSEEWVDDLRDAAARSIATAQVHATLALVEQQRIANLIALAAVDSAIHNESLDLLRVEAEASLVEWVPHSPDDEHPEIRPDIAAALGIGGGDE